MIKEKQHLTKEGLERIRQIKAGMNRERISLTTLPAGKRFMSSFIDSVRNQPAKRVDSNHAKGFMSTYCVVHSKGVKTKIDLARENHPLFGTTPPSEETKSKISKKLSSPVEITDIKTNTKIIYDTSREAAKSFPCCTTTINRSIRTQKLYKNTLRSPKGVAVLGCSGAAGHKITRVSTFTKSIELNSNEVSINKKDIYLILGKGGKDPS